MLKMQSDFFEMSVTKNGISRTTGMYLSFSNKRNVAATIALIYD